jgi:hypothetical protein
LDTDLKDAQLKLSRMSSEEAAAYFEGIASQSRNDLVAVQWDVIYDDLGHDMLSVAEVTMVNTGDILLQIWLRNAADGIWIPERQPWVNSVLEFKPDQLLSSAKIGLLDSKWTKDDIGRKYIFHLWGYFMHDGKIESFSFEKLAVYPG